MRGPRYPLEPLVKVRGDQVDVAVRGLAEAVRERDAAERARAAQEARRRDLEAAAEKVRRAEGEALVRGELSVGDLSRAGAWELRAASEHQAVTAEVERTQGHEERAREAEAGARGAVASRKADAEVVLADQARWREALRKKTETREEEAAEEAFRPGR